MSVQERNLRRWLEQNMNSSRARYGSLAKIQVRHIQSGNRVGDEVSYYEAPEEPDEMWAESTTREILDTLTNEAENLGGVQKFACFAYFSKSDEPINRHVVRMRGTQTPEEEERSLDTESPNNTGLVSASQRHTEAAYRLLIMAVSSQTQVQSKMIDKLGSMVETLLEQRFQDTKLVNDLLDKKAEREIQLEDAKTKQQAVRAGIDSAKLLAPVIANKLLKKRIFNEPDNMLAKLGHQFFGSIANDPKQLASIVGTLKPEQQAALMELIDSFEQKAGEKEENGSEKESAS